MSRKRKAKYQENNKMKMDRENQLLVKDEPVEFEKNRLRLKT